MPRDFPFNAGAFYRNQPIAAWILVAFTLYLVFRVITALVTGATQLEYALAGAIVVAIPWCVWSYRTQSAVSMVDGILTFRDRPAGRRTRIRLEDVAVVGYERSGTVDIGLRSGGVRAMSAAWLTEADTKIILAALREYADREETAEAG